LNCRGNDSYSGYRDKGHIGVTPYDYECFKRVAEKMCIKAGVKLIYNATLVGCDAENGKVKCAYLGLKDGIYCINSKVFVDTTGDGALSYFAGAKWEYGNENGEIQASSLFYTISGVDKELLDKHMKDSKDMRDKFYMDEIVEAREKGEFPCGTYKLRIYELPNGNWSVNMTQTDEQINVVDGEAVTEAEISQREQIPAITEFLRKYIPALKNIKILTSADALGIRESRRIVGDYVLKKEDMVKSTHFDDVIAVCSNFVDIHLKSRVEYIARESNDNYYIPLRSLIVKDFSNLMVAGRCASADHYVMAAIRVMPPCFAMGEAAGICAAFASKGNVSVRDVKASRVQAKILENGGYLE
ncbi:MAG: FAD-dependent oxidoreductase, partial [Clostridia bacterium]|nr:FAD-dependent oxidoreductase [Clostridia bacterium]